MADYSRHNPFDGQIPDVVRDKIVNGKRGFLSLYAGLAIIVILAGAWSEEQ